VQVYAYGQSLPLIFFADAVEQEYNRPARSLTSPKSTPHHRMHTPRGQIFRSNSSARMRKLRSVLVLLAALALSLSFAIPAEDVPETPYDESEALPYEATPPFSIMLQESARTPQSVLTFAFRFHFSPPASDEIPAEQRERSAYPISDSLTILDHFFRC
jgi:hypothetical protein